MADTIKTLSKRLAKLEAEVVRLHRDADEFIRLPIPHRLHQSGDAGSGRWFCGAMMVPEDISNRTPGAYTIDCPRCRRRLGLEK